MDKSIIPEGAEMEYKDGFEIWTWDNARAYEGCVFEPVTGEYKTVRIHKNPDQPERFTAALALACEQLTKQLTPV